MVDRVRPYYWNHNGDKDFAYDYDVIYDGDFVTYKDHKAIVNDISNQIGAIVKSLKDNPHGWIKHGQMLQEIYRNIHK